MANSLDFNLIPEYNSTSSFMRLPNALGAAISKFPQTEERIDGALTFCAHVLNCGDPEKVPDPARRTGAYLRAALAEYASIKEAFNRERPAGTPKFKLLDIENPVPHILKQLRNMQIHLVASETSPQTISLIMRNRPGAEPVNVTIWTIKDLTDAQFHGLDAFRRGHYTPAQATEMVTWLTTRQSNFGIPDLIHRGLVEAAERIVTTYLPQAQSAASSS